MKRLTTVIEKRQTLTFVKFNPTHMYNDGQWIFSIELEGTLQQYVEKYMYDMLCMDVLEFNKGTTIQYFNRVILYEDEHIMVVNYK